MIVMGRVEGSYLILGGYSALLYSFITSDTDTNKRA